MTYPTSPELKDAVRMAKDVETCLEEICNFYEDSEDPKAEIFKDHTFAVRDAISDLERELTA